MHLSISRHLEVRIRATSASLWHGARQARCLIRARAAPRAVVFDLGKVLLDFDFSRAAKALSALHTTGDVSAERLLELFGHGLGDIAGAPSEQSLVEQFERGMFTTLAFYEAVAKAGGLTCGLQDFCGLYADIFTPNDAMVAQQQMLRSVGVPTYICSNSSELHIQHVKDTYPFFSGFDGYILSYEVRSYKPEEEMYRAVEHVTGLTGPDLLFIDDKAANVAGARPLGWHLIHHTRVDTSLQQMAKLGLPVVEGM